MMCASDTHGRGIEVFEALLPLKDDPEAFEAKRQEIIEQFISEQPEDRQDQCRRRQWRFDQARARFKHPVNDMVAMFWEQFFEFKEAIELLSKSEIIPEPVEKAKVLEFKKPQS